MGEGRGPALDPVALARLRRIGGEELAARMAGLFLGLVPDRLRDAREAMEAGDPRALGSAAHSLKSSSGNVGALAVTEAAGRLEDAAEEAGGTAALAPLLERLEAALAAAEPELRELASSAESGE